MKLFFTASLCLVLGLLVHGSSGHWLDNILQRDQGRVVKNLFGRAIGTQEDGQGPTLAQVTKDLCEVQPSLKRLFNDQSPNGRYMYTFEEAKYACKAEGAALASYEQLYEAWLGGLEVCTCGWLSNGTAAYPMQDERPNCGNAGINICEWQTTWNAWCFGPLSICG